MTILKKHGLFKLYSDVYLFLYVVFYNDLPSTASIAPFLEGVDPYSR